MGTKFDLTVNILGCLLMGIFAAVLLQHLNLNIVWHTTILVGFLGGLTTFSSFTLDVVEQLERGDYFKAVIYVLSSVILCLLATSSGIWLVKIFNK